MAQQLIPAGQVVWNPVTKRKETAQDIQDGGQFFSDQWVSYTGQDQEQPQGETPQAPSGTTVLYNPERGEYMIVPDGDTNWWLGQGWQREEISGAGESTLPGMSSVYPPGSDVPVSVLEDDVQWWVDRQGWTADTGVTTTTQPSGETTTGEPTTTGGMTPYEINSMYQKYFGRNAESAEMDYWTGRSDTELRNQLESDYSDPVTGAGHPYDGSPIDKGQTQSRKDLQKKEATDEGLAFIEEARKQGRITDEWASLLSGSLEAYGAETINAEDIIASFEEVRKEIDPHFQGLTDLMIQSIKDSLLSKEEQRLLELQQEGMNKEEAIRTAQGELESKGLTFTGKGVEELGVLSAYAPGQVPSGTLGEGSVQKRQNLIAESSQARHQAELKQIGLSAEEQLGSEGLAGLSLPYAKVGGVSGIIPTQQQEAYAAWINEELARKEKEAQFEQPLDYYSTYS